MPEDKSFQLEVLTPEKTWFSGRVTSLVAPAELGYLGVLANHAPMVTTLTPGNITFRDPEGRSRTLRSGGAGFLEVRENKATVLADRIES